MKKPPKLTAMPGKRSELAAWIDRVKPERIGESEAGQIRAALAPISDAYFRKLLRESGVPLAPMIEGVRQSTLDELESSLLALLGEYESSDAFRRQAIRKLIITAKDHARWSVAKHPEKQEMILWMTTWLENPPVFRTWLKLRRNPV